MMVRTKQHEVVDARFPALDPMMHVMCGDKPRAVTPWERAVSITRPQRAPKRRRHRAMLASDIQRRSAVVLRHDDDTGVASNALDRFDRDIRSPDPSMEG